MQAQRSDLAAETLPIRVSKLEVKVSCAAGNARVETMPPREHLRPDAAVAGEEMRVLMASQFPVGDSLWIPKQSYWGSLVASDASRAAKRCDVR